MTINDLSPYVNLTTTKAILETSMYPLTSVMGSDMTYVSIAFIYFIMLGIQQRGLGVPLVFALIAAGVKGVGLYALAPESQSIITAILGIAGATALYLGLKSAQRNY
jgi:hypothetical protein